MESIETGWGITVAPTIRAWWAKCGAVLLLIAVVYMAAAALGRLAYAFPYLLWDLAPWAAIDLKHRYEEVHRWFMGLPVYGVLENGDYLPASYAMLWPLLGWLPIVPARMLWAITTVGGLTWLAYLLVRESNASTRLQRLLVALLAFSIYPVQMTIFVGQLGNHVLPLLLAGLLWLHQRTDRWRNDLLAATLLVPALVKPTLSVPFFWVVWFVPGRFRPLALVTIGYGALTILAASFQGGRFFTLLQGWIRQQRAQVNVLEGHANIHKWLAAVGLETWMLPVSLLILALLGIWIRQNRQRDFWLLLGVAALVARFWTHHRMYDDVMIIVPMITLFRLAKQGPVADGSDVMAGVLFLLTWFAMHIPTWAFYDLHLTFVSLIEAGQTVLWMAVLVFLIDQARRETKADAYRQVPRLHLMVAMR